MPLTADDRAFLKGLYQSLDDRALEPGDPRYQPIYEHPGCEDPVKDMERRIEYADVESLSLFSGFNGSGKTTELFRLRKRLKALGFTVLYGDALEYVNPASPIEIADLLIVLAGAFSDALDNEGINIKTDNFWSRLRNWLVETEVGVKELGLKTGAEGGVDLKLEFRTSPLFRQRLSKHMSGRIGELRGEALGFFEDGVKAVRKARGEDAKLVFLFDSLEQIRGSLLNEQAVTRSVEMLFSIHLKLLEIPFVHVVYTVPPWLKFILPGVSMIVLPCLRLWNNDPGRSECGPGASVLNLVVTKRFVGEDGLQRFFGPDPLARARELISLSGGHFRDLLRLLRETVIGTDSLPTPHEAINRAIARVRSSFLPISIEDAKWLAGIERERETLLKTTEAVEVNRLAHFLDTHMVLYLRNGTEWYDVHPLVRDEVKRIVAKAAAVELT